MNVSGTLYATVFTRFDKDVILVLGVHLLEFLDFLKHYIVHAVLVGAENALGFDSYYHDLNSI
jgi:hypothetical protein